MAEYLTSNAPLGSLENSNGKIIVSKTVVMSKLTIDIFILINTDRTPFEIPAKIPQIYFLLN